MSDPHFIDRLRTGDRQAFRELYEQFQDKVYTTVHALVQDQEDALDLSQEVFVEVFRSLQGFRGDSTLSTWVYRIAVNKSLNHLKRKQGQKFFGLSFSGRKKNETELRQVADPLHNPEQRMQNKELGEMLQSALARLPERQRTAFILHKVEELSYKEIADILQTSLSSVESLIHRAKDKLQEILLGSIKP
jgi:RNA polymerase sigma-70 factor (ECF subfamily)